LLVIGAGADGGVDVQGDRLLGVIFLILGILALAYGGFTYTETEEKARIGPVKIEIQDKERVNIPLWVGVASAVGGVALLMARVKD
jgi:uncharacterized membrane protein YidH (DUF202 family)